MGAADPGADEAAGLDAGGQRREHALAHRPSDPRHEHHPALPQGDKRDSNRKIAQIRWIQIAQMCRI